MHLSHDRRKGVIVGNDQDGDDSVITAHVSFFLFLLYIYITYVCIFVPKNLGLRLGCFFMYAYLCVTCIFFKKLLAEFCLITAKPQCLNFICFLFFLQVRKIVLKEDYYFIKEMN